MAAYIARRTLQTIPVLFIVSALIFSMLRLFPGDPALYVAGPDITEEGLAAIRIQMGLDRPILVQYAIWLGNAVRGDLGASLHSYVPVGELIALRLPASLELGIAGMLVTVLIGVPLGLLGGLRPGTRWDAAATTFSSLALAVPLFWFAILLIMFFSVHLGWVPPGSRVGFEVGVMAELRHLMLPAISLGIAHAPFITRFLRNGILDVVHEDYVRTAIAKGIPRSKVVRSHIVRNALIPVITMGGIVFGSLLGGVVVTEAVFNWPGLGTLMLTAINRRDYAVVQAAMLVVVVIFVSINLIVDLLYGVIDPRVRTERAEN